MIISFPCSLSTSPASQPPAITPGPLLSQAKLMRRDQAQVCGNLSNQYPNAQEPICAGTASICTFSGSQQGCCDDSGNCTFFTSCNEGYSPKKCDGPSCLQCSQDLPYCSQYAFAGSDGTFYGYSCGALDISGLLLTGITGSATTNAPLTSGVTSATTTDSDSISSTTSPTTTRSSSQMTGTRSATNTSLNSTATATATDSPDTESSSNLSHGALAGIIVGAVIVAFILICIAILCYRKNKRNKRRRQSEKPHFLQRGRAHDDDSDS